VQRRSRTLNVARIYDYLLGFRGFVKLVARHVAANLRAAMRATLAAYAEGERDPLWYLRDELNAPQASSAASRRPA
jgi:hypothetical protein